MYIAQTDSTNNLLREHYLDREDLFTIHTDFQTAGRGQQGNGWESEQGKNLLFSTLLRDWGVPASEQFVLNEIVSLALYRTVLPFLEKFSKERLTIKWPNDLYYGDKKLAGVLIENLLQGTCISRSIVGIGLNVNQSYFRSSAPNPVSLKNITGKEWQREPILQDFLNHLLQFRHRLQSLSLSPFRTEIHAAYMAALFRREGYYLWQERPVSLEPTMPQMNREDGQFEACIDSVTPSGELVLLTRQNEKRTYHFKQVRYVL